MRFDEARGITVEMRRKETADGYRYFDDPDLPPLVLDSGVRQEAELGLHSSAFELRKLMVAEDGILHEQAATIAGEEVLHRFYRGCCLEGRPPREVAKWVCGELVRLLREGPLKIEYGALSGTIKRVENGELTLPQARQVFEQVYLSNQSIDAVVQQLGFSREETAGIDVHAVCAEVIASNPKVVADYQGGKPSAIMALVGPVMKATKGAARPDEIKALLEQMLAG
jgi:aspartyl-tRNA(Asn)/glutamyl-tRNA(Gln) amidotransferase subunit B